MAGETQRVHVVEELEAESKVQDEGTAVEKQSDTTTKESLEHFSNTGTEARASSRGAEPEKLEKERDCPQQREAVIRPQQAGKIDFRSLQNQTKFSTDRTWSTGKGCPQSPSGKGRSREKGKRSGKAERGNPQQLYRLTITNPRSNPTIGIAYPQQKVSPPKKLETSRVPVSGSYRFHIPSMPEREAELQHEELSYSRCFPEASPNLTSPSYTSQTLVSSSGTSSQTHPTLSQQQPASMETTSTQPSSQLILADFHLSGSNTFQSPERTFNGANYGVSSQKSTALTETNKPSAFLSGPFQYGYHFLEESTSDAFSIEQNPQSQDFTDSSLGSVHVTHNTFSFSSGEGQNIAQNSTQFSNEQQSEDRNSYSQPPQSQFIQGVTSSIQCPRNLSEDSASSDSSGFSSQQSEQGKTTLSESTDVIGQADSRDAAITSGSKRTCHPKDTAANQRTHIQGSVHHARTISQSSGSQMHFSNKTFNNLPVNNIRTASMPFDKNINNKVINRLPHTWDGPNKVYLPADQNTIQYTEMNDKFHFQKQSTADQRSDSSKNSRVSWQQIRPPSAMPMQNRLQLSRQICSQKLAYMVSTPDWQDDSKSQKHGPLKTPTSFQNSRTSDGFSSQRQDTLKHSNNTVSTFKVEMSHAQVCESKNKAVYFGLNQPLPAASRNYSYPPLQVPPMGLLMVSPYESPLPSPVHNPASSSTCSSLSPASTSPVNLSSEDSQMSKSATTHAFYPQAQAKTHIPSDHLSSHPHQFHSDAGRSLSYTPERPKEEMMSYLQNNTHPKSSMNGNKGYMDSFGVEHQQPPPPYSAHQLLATSLATANLDQLDVLLTCKQCDQNFNNLGSFLGHKQYCTQHTFQQNDFKDISKMEDSRKFQMESTKIVSSVSNVSMSRCPSDPHLSLLGLNKNGDLISDSETKGDTKDDPMKLNLFSTSGNLPVPLPELELEDAKLDSLITEALNGYQSDNAEIDSSFIDAFADDDLTTIKATSNKQCLKTKEPLGFETKSKKSADDDGSLPQGKYFYDSDVENPETDKQYAESKLEKIPLKLKQDEKISIKKEVTHKNSKISSREKTKEQDIKEKEPRKLCKTEDRNTNTRRFLLSSKFSERCGLKSFQDSSAIRGSLALQTSTSPTSRTAVKESKRKSTGGGTWSKELIHKIVQQKNKLHKLHVKGTKNLQFSLVMERLTPTVQNPAFGEYDYVSDSDDECEPVKIASQGRLNQSSRCKYTYTKECKWRARSERDQAAWRHESKECFEVKRSEEVSLSPEKHGCHQRLRRRGSRSSTSSELSTSVSVSSESINSPKSTDCTDSDCEKKTDIKKKASPEHKSCERYSPQKLCKESNTLALTLTKSVKKYNNGKPVLSDNKDTTDNAKKNKSNSEVTDPMTSSPKVKETNKNFEKSRTSQTKSIEKLVSPRNVIGPTVNLDRSTLTRTDNLCPKVEPTQSSSQDKKPLQLDSHFSTTKREPDVFLDTNTESRRSEGPQDKQPDLSESNVLEKQSACLLKEPITLVSDLDPHKPASLCTSLMDDVCLTPTESQGSLIQKDTLHLMPYPLDQEQGLMKSPLSFDTSSMFGDLTGFDNGLYADMSIQKGFHSIEHTADKKEDFVSSFSPYLEQRDWSLMVSPVLPEEVSQYKGNSEKSNEKKSDYSHIPLSLPEKIIDYSANLDSCASEDELEIKRIVNELENQLQTTKMESPPLVVQDVPKELKMRKFSPLHLSDDSGNGDSGLDMKCPVQTIVLPVTGLVSESFTEPWSSPFRFELMSGNHSPCTPIQNEQRELEHFTKKEDDSSNCTTASHINYPELNNDQKSEERSSEKESPAGTKEDILEQKTYAESLMKSLEVISDSIYKKETIIPEHKEPNVTSLMSQRHQEIECQATVAVERENHSEKEAITRKENKLSPPNINERNDSMEFSLNVSNDIDHIVDGNHPISSLPSEPVESNGCKSENNLRSEDNITENGYLIETAHFSSVAINDLDGVEKSSVICNAAGNLSQVFNDHSVCPEHLTTIVYEKSEIMNGITGQSVGCSSSPTLPVNTNLDTSGKVQNVIKDALEEQSTPPNGGHLKLEYTNGIKTEIVVEKAEKGPLIQVSPSKDCSPTTDMSVEIPDKPCSPILEETNTDSMSHCSPMQDTESISGRSNLLILSQSEGIIDSDSCKITTFDTIHKQEEILNVQDIKDLPVDFMASHQNSPCREEVEESNSVVMHTAPPTSPLLSTSPVTPIQKWDIQDSHQSQSKFNKPLVNQSSVQNENCPISKGENGNVNKALNTDGGQSTAAIMEYSLINPPPLDLGIIECKMSNSETTIPSPLPVTKSSEPPEVSDVFEKRDLMFDFKLSPLNYNSISDEPPQLSQYDYIPLVPTSNPEENVDLKQPREGCGPCDVSVNPGLIFNNSETETERMVTLNSDPVAELSLSDEALDLQPSMKFNCFPLSLKNQSQISTTDNVKSDVEVRCDSFGPAEHSNSHSDLLKNVQSEILDSYKAGGEDGTLKNKALIICENGQMTLSPISAEKNPTTETYQCSSTLQVQEEISSKKTRNSAQQGKVLCEICLMCFRTVPGLKRHKAMKHLVRTDKHIELQRTSNNQMLIYEAPKPTDKEPKDDFHTSNPTRMEELPDTDISLASKDTESVVEEMAAESSTVAANEIESQNSQLSVKAKKYSKAGKNKNNDVNVKANPFCDEFLNLLKTDLLQAITSEFKSNGQQVCSKSPDNQVEVNDRIAAGELLPDKVTSAFDSIPQSPPQDINQTTNTIVTYCTSIKDMANEDVCTNHDAKSTISKCKDVIKECNDSRKTLCAVEELCEQKASDESLAQEILRKVAVEVKCEKNNDPSDDARPVNSSTLSPPELSPELKALIDDDTTFSQLFPRDEEAKRKKCPRVYSKRNKRQKVSSNSNGDCPSSESFMQIKDESVKIQAEHTFTGNQTNPCEYKTISIDDAIMLNMCHDSALKADVKQRDQQDVHENITELGSSVLNSLESTTDASTVKQSESSSFDDTDATVTSDPSHCKTEVSTPCPLLLPSVSYTAEPSLTESAQTFHSIDIQNINTTFQLPEIQFFDSYKEVSLACPVATADKVIRDDEKSKTTEPRGRKRQDGRMKVKDKQYKCKVCFTWFLTLGELNFHKLSHNPSPPPTCYMCVQRKFSSREQLRDHLREKHTKNKTGIWTCGMCLKEISDVWMYNEHLREHATQFARKGQTQSSMLGIPGSLMQETAVKNFITSIMQHRSSKTNRESGKVTKEQEKAVAASGVIGEETTSDVAEPKVHKTKSKVGAAGKQTTLTPLEILRKTETHKSVEMHPNCKDPSRDCHHCGKQFPKPFKLQRHLVVHNLEKIFLCHKCPVSYQEAQELRGHLKRAHEEVDELDSKHTTLYTCELCADVMHVIKKSFICSTCNYTFSKKEQFDRHMEKHLSEGNKIFKFRGVLRPVKASSSKEDECDLPATKKRRILSDSQQENSSDSGIASVSSLCLNHNSETQYSKPSMSTAEDSTQTITNECHSDTNSANVKTEDITEDYSELLVELEKCIEMRSAESATPKEEEIDPTTSAVFDKESNGKSITEQCDVKKENESVCIRAKSNVWSVSKESSCEGEDIEKDDKKLKGSVEGDSTETEEHTDSLPPSEAFVILEEDPITSKTPESAKHELATDAVDQQRVDEKWHQMSKDSQNDSIQQTLCNGVEQESDSQVKEKASLVKTADSAKNSTGTCSTKTTEHTTVLQSKISLNASASSEDKESVRPQKKRKDMKSTPGLQRLSSPATQENFGVESLAKKKFRPNKCAKQSLKIKSDESNDYPVLSSVRDDVVSNKIVSKSKTSNMGLQLKRSLLDGCAQKKAETVTPFNVDFKAKKGPLGRPLHPPISKVSSVPMNNSLNKSRPKMGVRSMESHSYRTAESQNHLLSQLFGQKLTSFKIPLRKDTSESIN
ncbi:zinc finger protein 469 [Antennarius striatus]|uniref:zinc finger protein 469 n=1 Tax=Antennarius striatus TaxID=241820 RepID=UPI0035B40AD2